MYPISTMFSTTTVTSKIYNNKNPISLLEEAWPLSEYEERRIMDALSTSCSTSSLSPTIYSEEKEDDNESVSPTTISGVPSSATSYFSDRAIFQLQNNNQATRRHSLCLKCPTCQRPFHSQGNLSNHMQLYHY